MKKLLMSITLVIAFSTTMSAKDHSDFLQFKTDSNPITAFSSYITVYIVMTAEGSKIEINGRECAERFIAGNGGEIIGIKHIPKTGPTPLKCADLPSDPDTITPPGGGGSGGGGGGTGGIPNHDFKPYNPDDDVFN